MNDYQPQGVHNQPWRADLEKLLRDQMPYAFPTKIGTLTGTGTGVPAIGVRKIRPEIDEEDFKSALGYILENVEMRMKEAYFEGYASGGEDTTFDINLELNKDENRDIILDLTFDKPASRIGAERAWQKWTSIGMAATGLRYPSEEQQVKDLADLEKRFDK